MIIGSDSRSFCHPPLPLAFFSTLFKTRGKGYVYIVNYGCSCSERPSWWRHLLITSTAAPLIRCLPNPCNDILILDNHVTVFNVSILFCVCVCCVFHVFICWQTMVCWSKKSTVPVSHYLTMSEAHPFLNPRTKVMRPVYGSAQ